MIPKSKFEKNFTYIALIIGLIIAVLFFTVGCSTTKEISVKTEETTTIQPINVAVPPITGVIPNIPLTKPDTYEGSGTITTKDTVTGKTSTAKVKVKVTVKKTPQGKPVADVQINTQQDSVRVEAKVTNSKVTTNTNTVTEPFLITIWNDVKWWFLGLFVFLVGAIIVLKKFFPALIKTYLKI